MSAPFLSIIIPAYNAAANIRRITQTILTQPFTDFELILVDDGSTDDTLDVLRILEQQDNRIKVHTKPNGGPSSARNVGLAHARGDFIQFYDADDTIPPTALTVVTTAIQRLDVDVLISGWSINLQTPSGLIKNYKQITPPEERVAEHITEYALRSLGTNGTLYNLWNKLFRADIIRAEKLCFREDLRFGEDLIFSLEYFQLINSLGLISDVTYHYQESSASSVFARSSIVPEYRLANDEAIQTFIGDNPTPAERDLALWLRWRWLMSYWSLVSSSDRSFAEKRRLVAQFSPANLPLVTTPHFVGYRKFILQFLARIACTTTLTSLLPGYLFQLLKRFIILGKTWLRKIRRS